MKLTYWRWSPMLMSKKARFIIAATMYIVSSPAFSACQYAHYVVDGNWPDEAISKGAFYAMGAGTGYCIEVFSESAQGACDAYLAQLNAQPSSQYYRVTSIDSIATYRPAYPEPPFYWGYCLSSGITSYTGGSSALIPGPIVIADVVQLRQPKTNAYSITLSGGSEVETWNKETDASHKKATLIYTATVMDASKQPAQPAPNVEVTITTDVTENSGGHNHNNDRPKGKLAIPSDPIKDGKETITGKTDSKGVYSFVFGAEEASGTHTITATCKGCSNNPQTAPVNVKVDGLQPIPATPFMYSMQLPNRDTNHPATFYLTKASIGKLRTVALYYYMATFKKKKKGVTPDFVLNDASLEWGGVLDCYLTCNSAQYPSTPWHKHHIEHRRGSVVDVKANGLPGSIVYDRDFRYWATYFRVGVGDLHGSGSSLHYHLRLNNGAKE